MLIKKNRICIECHAVFIWNTYDQKYSMYDGDAACKHKTAQLTRAGEILWSEKRAEKDWALLDDDTIK